MLTSASAAGGYAPPAVFCAVRQRIMLAGKRRKLRNTMQSAATPTPRILNIIGDTVALGPFDQDLLPLYLKWINDFAVTRYFLNRLGPRTRGQRAAWYEQVSKGGEDIVVFTIYERATLRAIGHALLEDINYLHRTATYGLLIGEKDCWGKGYGTETTRLMLDYGFTVLGLHNILLQAMAGNTRAIRAYTRAGFRVIGSRREAHRFGGQLDAVIYMDCLASEFESPVLRSLTAPAQKEDDQA
jgi:RimJ/RimL family protein N-acetyltransferase